MMAKLVKFLFVFSIGFLSFFSVNGAETVSPGSITGRIVDEAGYVLPGATIRIEGAGIGTVSNVDGFFRISGLRNGTYKVTISYIGYGSIEKNVVISGNKTTEMNNIVLKEGVLMQEVIVTGLNAQHKALAQQRNNIHISNIISADQVARFPDSNIGDALKRIPGISVQYDQGEARFGHIRGTSPDLSSVTIDGTRIPSAESDIRSVQLDLIPSDMIQTIEVNKVVMPHMDADAIGGSVNLITKSQPSGRRINALFGSGWNLISEKPTWNLGFAYGNRFLKNKLGVVAALSYQNNPLGSDNVEFEWEKMKDGKVYVKDYQVRQYFVQRERQSYSLSLDYVFNPDHKIEISGMYNKRNDWENRYRLRIRNIEPDEKGNYTSDVERQLKFGIKDNKYTRLEDQRVLSFSLKGEHHFQKLAMDWKMNYSKASEERPNERYLNYRVKGIGFSNDLSNPRTPYASAFSKDINDSANFSFNEMTESYQYTSDRDLSAKIDFKLPIHSSGAWKNSIRFGANLKVKSKDKKRDFYEYTPIDKKAFDALVRANLTDMKRSNFLAGNYQAGFFPDKKVFGDIALTDENAYTKERVLKEDATAFDADETVWGAYLRYDQRINDKVDFIAGLRMEHTASAYNANKYEVKGKGKEKKESIVPIAGKSDSYFNFLPSLIAKWDVTNDLKMKAAWTNTLARPKYIDLAPRQNISRQDEELSIGNPELKPTTSMNFDLMAEYYTQGSGLLSAGIFYKDISKFIVNEVSRNQEMMGTTWRTITRPVNGGDADLFGVELAVQQKMRFLPGFFRHINVYGNYTYNYSNVKNSKLENRKNEQMRLPGTPEHTFNAALGYEMKRFSARLSYNYASSFIDELGNELFYDRFYDAVNYLDFNINAKIGKHVNIFANVNNILNQPLRYYQGSKEKTMQVEYYNFRFDAGVKLNF